MRFFVKDKLFDGGLGTMLIARGLLRPGMRTESLNLTAPDAVAAIHREYAAAGANYITANTFGANPLADGDYAECIRAGVEIAKRAGLPVGLDVGPTGRVPAAADFDSLYACFRDVVRAGVRAGADFIVIETVSGLVELRAALLAAKENSDLPVAALMSFEANARSVYGVRPDSFALVAEALGADAVGANCSVGPADMCETLLALTRATALPVIMMPNAGLPAMREGQAVYDLSAEDFAASIARLKALGADIVGGCCGTTPAYIAMLKHMRAGTRPAPEGGALASAQRYFFPDLSTVGERINPTGKPRFRAALADGDLTSIDTLCIEQARDGADMLDVNVGVAGKEYDLMERVLPRVADLSPLPLVIDSSDPAVLERALRLYPGRALVNSVSGKKETLASVLPLVRRYGAAVVGLTLDDDGIPETAAERVRIAGKILAAAGAYGIAPHDVYIDALTLAEASVAGGALVTLETLKGARAMGARTILGVSNVSFGMPLREDLNAAFLELARGEGLDLAIVNPKFRAYNGSKEAKAFLTGALTAEGYIEYAAGAKPVPRDPGRLSLRDAIVSGDWESARNKAETLLKTEPPLAVAESEIIPALNRVGEDYAAGVTFLPGLIAAAEAAEAAFAPVRAALGKRAGTGRFVIATVKGDIHDIGKNITAAVSASYGVDVINLGKDVPYDTVVEAVRENYPCVLGLSALMTTTAANMAETVKRVRAEFPELVVLSGGAAITEEFCRAIGTVYCASATDTAKYLDAYFKRAEAGKTRERGN